MFWEHGKPSENRKKKKTRFTFYSKTLWLRGVGGRGLAGMCTAQAGIVSCVCNCELCLAVRHSCSETQAGGLGDLDKSP